MSEDVAVMDLLFVAEAGVMEEEQEREITVNREPTAIAVVSDRGEREGGGEGRCGGGT